MKEHPILFSTPMVQAILEKRKTQTRRLTGLDKINGNPDHWEFKTKWRTINRLWDSAKEENPNPLKRFFVFTNKINGEEIEIRCPYGDKAGDLLWVREKWRFEEAFSYEDEDVPASYWYYASTPDEFENIDKETCYRDDWKWKPSIHMPKEVSRIWLEEEEICIERIQDISEVDSIAEGVEKIFGTNKFKHYSPKTSFTKEQLKDGVPLCFSAKKSFRTLWQSINGKPKPIQHTENGKLITTRYIVYPFDEEAAKPFAGKTTWRNKPLTVITNPWVWVVKFNVLSTTGKPSFDSAQDDKSLSKSVTQ